MRADVYGGQANIIGTGYGDSGQRVIPAYSTEVATGKVIGASSSGDVINSVAHAVPIYNFIRFTSGLLIGREFTAVEIVDVDNFRVNYNFKINELPSPGDTFNVYRYTTPAVDDEGNVVFSPGPIRIMVDGVSTEVAVDTGNPANTVAIPVSFSASADFVLKMFHDYVGTPVDSSTWVEIENSTPAGITLVEVFDSSGQLLILGVGPAAGEIEKTYIFPGGLNTPAKLIIPSGSRIAIKAASSTANAGFLAINAYSEA